LYSQAASGSQETGEAQYAGTESGSAPGGNEDVVDAEFRSEES
jgi:hypothetical protein